MTLRSTTIAIGLALAAAVPAYAGTIMVGGALAVVRAAGLVEQARPFTPFTPVAGTFAKLPAVPGRHQATELQASLEARGGEATLNTIAAETKAGKAIVTGRNAKDRNGVTHEAGTSLLP